MDKPISVGDLVMLVRGHECAMRLKGGLPWRVTRIVPQFGGGWHCPICGEHNLASGDLSGAQGCGTPPGIKGDPNGGMPLSWLKRIPPLGDLEGQPTQEDMKEPA
jgi:hypothetical protein